MSKNKKKLYLIETSAVRAAIGETTRAHNDHFKEMTSDGTLSTSLFIRMEFLRRWIYYYLKIALMVDLCKNLEAVLNYESESFKQRDIKTLVHLISALNRSGKEMSGKEIAKEIVHVAVTTLRKFDRQFSARTNNSCGCRIGGKEFRPDFSTLFEDVREFLKSGHNNDGCGMEAFLNLSKPSKASKLLDITAVSSGTSAGEQLLTFKKSAQPIKCKDCGKFGDIVIALEQPARWCLVHIDKAFDILCKETSRSHIRIKSLRAIEKIPPQSLGLD